MMPARLAACVLALLLAAAPFARGASPAAGEVPSWFTETFLDLRDDIHDAARSNRRVMLYFHQEGCPYCRKLVLTSFTQQPIVEKMRRHFTAIALDLWGDREVTWIDGRTMPEKDFARMLDVQFTPTLLFLDEKGKVVARANGYYPPHRFEAALDYVAGRREAKEAFGEYMARNVKEAASESLHDEPFFVRTTDLRRKPGAKPLAVLFETAYCAACDELHAEGLRRPEMKAMLARFDVARYAIGGRTEITTPQGERLSAAEWARRLAIAYTPSVVFFSPEGREVFRIEGYLRPFHLAGSFEYVASGAWRTEPNFQRFLRAKAERMREKGQKVELWK